MVQAIHFENSYARLPERFYQRIQPSSVSSPALMLFNDELAKELGINKSNFSDEVLAQIFSGNLIVPSSEPIALAYAGHQFGVFVPQLGDGRALLLGEVIDKHGNRRDIQLKGSGKTMFSRLADGRAALGPVLREYIISEAMHSLGIPTTRSLAVVTTGDTVQRQTILPGAILTRVASSHVRVGTFEYFASRHDVEGVKILADYVIARHYPDLQPSKNPYISLLNAFKERQASLVAKWMSKGFIHGVMNTDNTSIAGETIDYGPCAFMDTYKPMQVFSSIDRTGRYAYGNQPAIAKWNFERFAQCLVPLLHENLSQAIAIAYEIIDTFQYAYQEQWLIEMCQKIGIEKIRSEDAQLLEKLLSLMEENEVDYTLCFRSLMEAITADDSGSRNLQILSPAFESWIKTWKERLQQDNESLKTIRATMARANPVYIPRNHLVERAIKAAELSNDFLVAEDLIKVLSRPYDIQEGKDDYILAPPPSERVYQTFCGT